MNRYWDLSEKERSELTTEGVESMLVIELMEKGVVKPEEPTLLPVEEVPEPDRTVYGVKAGYHDSAFVFESAEQAAALIASAKTLEYKYINGQSFYYVGDALPEVQVIHVYKRETLIRQQGVIEKNTAAEKANEAATKKYQEQVQAKEKAVGGVWNNYYECQQTAYDVKKVIDTFNEYTRICDGDTEKAFVFLGKAFDVDDIRTAFEWHEMEIPGVELDPVAVAAESSTEIETDELKPF